MSDRSDWVPIAAGVVVGAGLLVVLYKMFFSGTGSCQTPKHSKTVNQNIGAPKYICTCRKSGIALKQPEVNSKKPEVNSKCECEPEEINELCICED